MPKANPDFLDFVRLVVNGDIDEVSRHLAANPAFATAPAEVGATRQAQSDFFFSEIAHYLYAGDTALHMAAAAFRRPVAELLVARGADCRARNRRGAEPLHYAADANHWDPAAQAETIEYLLSVGADPNALDQDRRGAPAPGGANAVVARGPSAAGRRRQPESANKAGSTPLHLAVQTTGRGGSGSEHARQQQAGIIRLLLERGARPTDKDGARQTGASGGDE